MPASPSVSYSNGSTAHGSTAPMLPNQGDVSHTMTHRNKLVKRSSSQRALSNVAAHSTLRRPATSHQRSATLQQHYQLGEGPAQHATPRSSMLIGDLMEEPESSDDLIRSWQYFFRPKSVRLGKDGPSRVRSATGSVHRNDTLNTIVPDMAEPPTLLLATSITSRHPEDFANPPQCYGHRPPSTAGIPDDNSEEPPLGTDSGKRKAKPGIDQDLKPRRSFSIADIFSSSSPSTWKIPRSGSLRKAKGAQSASSGRRVVSAPQSTKPDRTRTMSQSKPSYATRTKSKPVVSRVDHPPPLSANPVDAYSRPPSSPLPPLNRLSSFDIELPGAAPSYPTTPQSDLPLSPSRLSSPPSPLMSSPLAPFSSRYTPHHPSLAISDRGSTLLGSDNDASRILSGDEDETDFRSETAYDSTRTGATGSSHSNIRRPPIEAMFGDPSSGEHEKNKSIALQELLSHDSFNTVDVRRHRIAEEEENMTTPIRVGQSKYDRGSPTPVSHDLEGVSDDFSLSLANLRGHSNKNPPKQMGESSVEEVWAIESLDESEKGSNHGKRLLAEATTGRSPSTPNLTGSIPSNTHSLARFEEPSSSTKANVFEWSESPPIDRDSSSSRPKTVHGRQGKDIRGSRTTARRGPSAMHLRSQSVPVAPESSNHRTNTSKLEAWVLGNKGVSEDWDTDFEFEEASAGPKQVPSDDGPIRTSISSGMLVPRSILERQASVHGQFGHVKELTILVEELKGLRQQAQSLDVMNGLSAELWKEADGIINLATLDDDEHDFLSPRSPNSPGFDVDPFEEDSPALADRRRSGASPSREHAMDDGDGTSGHHTPSYSTPERSRLTTPQGSRPRKESAAKAKSVLETIHQQRSHYSPSALLEKPSQKKLPFDTTSLRDLVTRAGVVTRALKQIIRRAEKAVDGPSLSIAPDSPSDESPPPPPDPPAKPDPAFSQIFQPPNATASTSKSTKSPRVTQSPKGSNSNFRGASIAGNDNEINGHMKLMTVV